MNNLFAIIMAGGEGTRFYPFSTPDKPKQFLNFIGDKSFIRQTFERILPLLPAENIYVSTSEKYIDLVKEHLPEVPFENIVAEPLKKNTAPALIYATALIRHRHGDSIICCLPSDHYIQDEDGFRSIIVRAKALAGDGYLVTLGMKPSWPSSDYGYICPDSVIPAAVSRDLSHPIVWSPVKQFTEKPKKDVAEEYIKIGYLWNGGIFIWHADTLLNEVAKYSPELNCHCDSAVTPVIPAVTPVIPAVLGRNLPRSLLSPLAYFQRVPSISIDYAIMERSDKVAVIPADIGWSDVGTWESIDRLITEGVNIAPRVCAVMKGDERCPWRRIVPKPWGHEEWWAMTNRYVGKLLFIKRGYRLSLQYHKVKEETLRLINGELELESEGGSKQLMGVGDIFHIPPGTIHRMMAMTDCMVMEVSTPEVGDVVRIEDDFGRIP